MKIAPASKTDDFLEALLQVEALENFTKSGLQYQTPRQNLNDLSSAEYAVQAVKYVYPQCVIVQLGVKNTLEDQILSKMTVNVTGLTSDVLKVAGVVGLPEDDQIRAQDTKYLYIVMQRVNQEAFPSCKVKSKLSFTITEIDVDTEDEIGSYEEDYSLGEIQLNMSDYVKPEILPTGMYKDQWEQLGSNPNVAEHV